MPAGGAGWDEENPWEGLQSGQFGCCSVAKSSLTFKREFCWNFSGGLVVKVLCLQCRGRRIWPVLKILAFLFLWVTEIPDP